MERSCLFFTLIKQAICHGDIGVFELENSGNAICLATPISLLHSIEWSFAFARSDPAANYAFG
jgi:hypothetical protein